MPYHILLQPSLERKLTKLLKKDKKQYERIIKKMNEIALDPSTYKPLRYSMKGIRRVHIDSFVLTFSIRENDGLVVFLDYDHHDKIYQQN
ncbi:MAG: type II toxin-antitoxin system RelE/ParE family toxin [archaeon]